MWYTKRKKREVSATRKYYADKTCKTILRVVALLVTITIICLVRAYLAGYPVLMWGLIILFGSVYILGGAIWLPLFLRSLVYHVSPTEVIVCSGVIYRNRMIMKMSAVRHVSVVKTPFSKATGMNFVILSATGGSVIMPFLSIGDMTRITELCRGE